jgi:hypothetical protein
VSKNKISPHLRHYGKGFSIQGSKLESAPPSKEALEMIAIVEEYVKHDKEGELCTVIHAPGKVCCKVMGHD